QFEKDFPNKRIEVVDTGKKYRYGNFTSCDLDLSEYTDLRELIIENNKVTSIKLSGCENLEVLRLTSNNLISVDFLNDLPNPEKLEILRVYDNNIKPTDIEIFRTTKMYLSAGNGNRFYGSLKSYQNLTKLTSICIEATDVDSGLEYLPMSLTLSSAKEKAENEKQGEKIMTARPEYFIDPNSRSKWISALGEKLNRTKQELEKVKQENPEKEKKIQRLESKIKLLEEELDFLAQENKKLKVTNQKLEKENSELRQQATSISSKSL
ncbi:12257_t:CDS:2, partial [Ambispora leptoticha]